MPTLRLTLFDRKFEVLDRVDIAVPGEEQHGAGQAMKAIQAHIWENQSAPDLDALLGSRQNLLERLDDLTEQLSKIQAMAKLAKEGGVFAVLKPMEGTLANNAVVQAKDVLNHILSLDLNPAKGAVMESKIMNDNALPKKYKEELEKRFGARYDQMGRKLR